MKRFAVLLLAASACGGATPSAAPASAPASAAPATPAKAPGDAKIGDRTTCPVSGEPFVVTETSPHAEYAGKTYYFCCPHCAEKFKAEPAKFTGASGT